MSDVSLFIAKPGVLKEGDKRRLRSAGIVVVEVEDPASVKFIHAERELDSSELLLAAMRALAGSDTYKTDCAFTRAVAALVEAKHVKAPI